MMKVPPSILIVLTHTIAARAICMTVGEIIARLHQNGIIHGDLTTSNLFRRSNNGSIVLLTSSLFLPRLVLLTQGCY